MKTPPLTLRVLRDHAMSKPDHLFPLGSCTECLAADLMQKPMGGHDKFDDGTEVPRDLARFTAGATAAARIEEDQALRRAPLTGAQIAAALNRIMAGADPYAVGREAWDNR